MIHSSDFQHRLIKLFTSCFIAIVAVVSLLLAPAVASEAVDITVYRDPGCRCCGGWMQRLTTEGFQPKNVPTSDMTALKQQYRIPNELASCHTAIINGYVVEGHVPVEDIKRLLAEQPNVAGIAVPGMPVGTPGMEAGDKRESFSVFSFDQQGNTEVVNQYSF